MKLDFRSASADATNKIGTRRKKGFMVGPLAIAIVLVTACLICTKISAADSKLIRGVDFFESKNYNGVGGVSFAGGGQIVILAEDKLHVTPSANQVKLTTADVSTSAITLAGTPVNEDDEFNSRINNGLLAYTLPSVSELFNGLPLSTFEDFSNILTEISVENLDTNDGLTCKTAGKCNVNY